MENASFSNRPPWRPDEIGHVLGLQHNANATSVMYFLNLEGVDWLDPTDLAALATHHKLRFAILDKPIKLTQPR